MMLRHAVRDLLNANDSLRGMLAGGIYPTDDHGASLVSRQATPLAFDAQQRIMPTMLVQDDGASPVPGTDRTAFMFVRLVAWQQDGRDVIDAALRQAFEVLNGAAVIASGVRVAEFRHIGDGPAVRDPGVQDAEQGWSRWRAAILRGA